MTLAFLISSIMAVALIFVALPGTVSRDYERRTRLLTNAMAIIMVGATVVGCILAVL